MIRKRLFLSVIFVLFASTALSLEAGDQLSLKLEEKKVLEWRKDRDRFFRTHNALLFPKKEDV
jgi:hypothetical protein